MNTFIEDYLQNPSQAIMNARRNADLRFSTIDCSDDMIYSQISSPEHRLYEEILWS